MVYKSPIAIHPGETLKDILDSFNMSQKELAQRSGLTEKHISNIINGLSPVTPDTALKFELLFKVSASFFNNLQSNYSETLVRIEYEKLLSNEIDFYREHFSETYNILKKYKYVETVKSVVDKIKSLHRYFGTTSLFHINDDIYNFVYFRKKDLNKPSKSNISAWIRAGEISYYDFIKSNTINTFDKKNFINLKIELKSISQDYQNDAISNIKKVLLDAGIFLVTVPYFSKSYVNGLTRWFGDTPMIQISDRNKSRDVFRFTLFHELGHIILHGKKNVFIDYGKEISDSKPQIEEEANIFASEVLIDPIEFKSFLLENNFDLTSIKSFARKVGVHYTIVLGRIAHYFKDKPRSVDFWSLYNIEKTNFSCNLL